VTCAKPLSKIRKRWLDYMFLPVAFASDAVMCSYPDGFLSHSCSFLSLKCRGTTLDTLSSLCLPSLSRSLSPLSLSLSLDRDLLLRSLSLSPLSLDRLRLSLERDLRLLSLSLSLLSLSPLSLSNSMGIPSSSILIFFIFLVFEQRFGYGGPRQKGGTLKL
jgi:hypothetical protein